METKTTYCRICEALCGLEVDVENGEVVAVRPDKDHVISKGYCCVKGMKMLDVHRDPDRLTRPLKRMPDGEFREIPWEQAISEIGAKVRHLRKEHGRHSVGVYMGNPAAFSYANGIFNQAFVMALGTRNLYTAGSQDCNNKFVVGRHLFGSSAIQGIPDFAHTKYFLCIGSNPGVSQMSFVHAPRSVERMQEIEARGGKVVFIGPRKIEAATQVGEHVLVRPDTDVYFLAALLHVLDREGWVDRTAMMQHATGLDELLAIIRPFSPERVAPVTGIPAAKIEEIARDFAKADGASCYCSTGLNQGSSGTLAYWFLNALNLVSGNFDRRGGMIVTKSPLDMASKAAAVTGAEKPRHKSRIGGFSPVIGSLPATILADEIFTPGEGQIRAMFVTAGNPILSCPNSSRLQEAFSQLDLLVSLDLYRNETAQLAHYVLPTTDFFQRDDFPLPFIGLQPEPFAQYTEAVAEAKGEQRQEWRIFSDIAEASGLKMFGSAMADRMFRWTRKAGKLPLIGKFIAFEPRRLLELMLLATPTRLSELKKHPHGMLLAPNQPGSFLSKRVVGNGGKVNLAPKEFVGEAAGLDAKLSRMAAQITKGDELLLFSKRERFTHNTWMHNIPEFVKNKRKTNYAYLNPEDAARRGIVDDMPVRVTNEWGSIELPAKLTDDVMQGAIAVPHGWGHQGAKGLRIASETSGRNVNELAADGAAYTERLSGMTQLNGIPVRVEVIN